MVARALSRGAWALLGTILLVALATRAPAQCVGDCGGDGEVTINDLILGVNVALGSQPVSACPAFANGDDEVTIAQLIQGVNNALNGCPPAATPTATHTGGGATPTDTATEPAATATASITATATELASATATATSLSTATATLASTSTATATVPASTATATPPATATHTAEPTATATAPSTATATPPHTATATATATHTAVPTVTATATVSATPSVTPTRTVTATPTETVVPPGESIAGRAALMSAGLGGIQSLIAAVVTAATNTGGAVIAGLPPPIDTDQCPISGTTSQSCTEMGSGSSKKISLVLGADQCVVPGPLGGSGEFDGSISINSNPFFLNSCSPLAFLSGAYSVDNLTVKLRDAMDIGVDVAAMLEGDVSITGVSATCLVGSLTLSLTGTLTSTLPDGSGVQVQFFDTTAMMSSITYNADCVPLKYTLKFNGDAAFTAIPPLPPALVNGIPLGDQFDVTFINLVLAQDATTSPVTMTMDGTINSSCWNGQLILDTLTPVAVTAGQLCPNAGMISVTGAANSMATVTYTDDGVTVTPQGGQPSEYPSCLSEELLMCVPA